MNTRKDNNGRAMAKWISTPPGHIAKPLRHIGSRTNARDEQGRLVLSAQFIAARSAANIGDGEYVQMVARSLA